MNNTPHEKSNQKNIDYRKELLKTFKDDAYWLVNKHLASHLGLVPTILLSELISKENYHYIKSELIEEKYFYHKSEVIEENLFISADKRRSSIEILKNSETISVMTKGMPAKHYYSINHQRIIELMSMESGTRENREKLKQVKSRSETPTQEVDFPSDRKIQSLVVPFSDLSDKEIQPKSSENPISCGMENGITIYNNKDDIKDNIKCENNKALEEKIEQFGKTEEFKDSAHTPEIQIPKQFSKEEYELARALGFNIDEALQPEDPKQLAIRTKQEEINTHYSNEIARVEQELNLQSDIMIPKLTIESLLEVSESFLGRVGIGFDNNPRRILNLIYNQLPKDFVIKEDSKDVEILGDMIKKYMSSGKAERDSIAKRIYQAVEAMLKIYVIKKYGDPYREIIFPEITKANLVLYLNCNPTFKYCLGGFSNDIDGVYSEVCRLAAKDVKKKVSEIKIEHDKKLRQLEANRIADMQAMFTKEEKLGFQARTNAIMDRMDSKPDISDEPLTKPIKANLTSEESSEMGKLFIIPKEERTKENEIRLRFLINKSK
jgi:hypothetical protein